MTASEINSAIERHLNGQLKGVEWDRLLRRNPDLKRAWDGRYRRTGDLPAARDPGFPPEGSGHD